MSKPKSPEQVKTERLESERIKYLQGCLETATLVTPDTKQAMTEVFSGLFAAIHMSFLMNTENDVKECDAVKYLIESGKSAFAQFAITFDEHVKMVAAGNGNQKLRKVTTMRKPKVTTVTSGEALLTPEQLVKAKVAAFTLK